mmetsp:Transcript_9460/g.28883  ORF Transcript_9460/g.28883 Transcript_9460/m.28883 type:complete len:201 (+) Transcript_9460:774-1376(+)
MERRRRRRRRPEAGQQRRRRGGGQAPKTAKEHRRDRGGVAADRRHPPGAALLQRCQSHDGRQGPGLSLVLRRRLRLGQPLRLYVDAARRPRRHRRRHRQRPRRRPPQRRQRRPDRPAHPPRPHLPPQGRDRPSRTQGRRPCDAEASPHLHLRTPLHQQLTVDPQQALLPFLFMLMCAASSLLSLACVGVCNPARRTLSSF